jgi:hypothetical protein
MMNALILHTFVPSIYPQTASPHLFIGLFLFFLKIPMGIDRCDHNATPDRSLSGTNSDHLVVRSRSLCYYKNRLVIDRCQAQATPEIMIADQL